MKKLALALVVLSTASTLAYAQAKPTVQKTAATKAASSLPKTCSSTGMRDNNAVFGNVECTKGNLKALATYGKAVLDNVNISGPLLVHGRLEATNSSFNRMVAYGRSSLNEVKTSGNAQFHGRVDIEESTFSNPVIVYGKLDVENSHFNNLDIYGPLVANRTVFNGDITMASNYTFIKSCKAKNLRVKEVKSDKSYHVFLDGTTTVNNVKFDGPHPGLVYMGKNAKLKGKIINGSRINTQG